MTVADGFSCKTQIEQAGVGRRALHVAQVMKLAREQGPAGPAGVAPEEAIGDGRPKAPPELKRKRKATLAATAAATAGAIAGGAAAIRGS